MCPQSMCPHGHAHSREEANGCGKEDCVQVNVVRAGVHVANKGENVHCQKNDHIEPFHPARLAVQLLEETLGNFLRFRLDVQC